MAEDHTAIQRAIQDLAHNRASSISLVGTLVGIIDRLDARAVELEAWQREAEHTIFEAGTVAGRFAKQRDELANAAQMMLDEAKNDVTGEYSSPAIRALCAALARLDEVGR